MIKIDVHYRNIAHFLVNSSGKEKQTSMKSVKDIKEKSEHTGY